MSKPIVKIVNASTGEEIERQMTDEEYVQYEKDQIEQQTRTAQFLETQTQRQVILEKLGITEQEAKLLLS